MKKIEKRFLSVSRMIQLQDSINWLNNYKPDGNENVIGEGIEDHLINKVKTEQLKRLGEINLERDQLINSLLKIG